MTIKIKPRKLQELGRFSFYLNMPKTWVEHHNLKRGDKISMEIDNDVRLILLPIKENEIKQTP